MQHLVTFVISLFILAICVAYFAYFKVTHYSDNFIEVYDTIMIFNGNYNIVSKYVGNLYHNIEYEVLCSGTSFDTGFLVANSGQFKNEIYAVDYAQRFCVNGITYSGFYTRYHDDNQIYAEFYYNNPNHDEEYYKKQQHWKIFYDNSLKILFLIFLLLILSIFKNKIKKIFECTQNQYTAIPI